jgi:hypothetical protein
VLRVALFHSQKHLESRFAAIDEDGAAPAQLSFGA